MLMRARYRSHPSQTRKFPAKSPETRFRRLDLASGGRKWRRLSATSSSSRRGGAQTAIAQLGERFFRNDDCRRFDPACLTTLRPSAGAGAKHVMAEGTKRGPGRSPRGRRRA